MSTSQVVLITGTSSGLGRATAQALARQGHTVFATMRGVAGKNAAKAAELRNWASSENVALHILELDVTDQASIDAAVKHAVETCGRIDVLINNAGYGVMGLAEAFTPEQWRSLFETNVFGPIALTQAVLPYMRKQQQGLLLYMSSTSGNIPYPFMGAYGASKAAIEGLALTINSEVYSLGIDTVILQAGAYATDFGSNVEMSAREEVWESYGPIGAGGKAFMAAFAGQFSAGYMSTPESLADKVVEIVALPSGQRPLKLAVGFGTDGFDAINNVLLPIQRQSIEAVGLGDFLKRPTAETSAN